MAVPSPPSPSDEARLEHWLAFFADRFPPMWKRLYDNCIASGFTEVQAMGLLKTYIRASSGTDNAPPRSNDTRSDS